MTDNPIMTAIGRRKYRSGEVKNVYDFRCPACGSSGELAVDARQVDVHCPEYLEGIVAGTCMARFVQFTAPGQTVPTLRCVNEAAARFQVGADAAHRRPLRFQR